MGADEALELIGRLVSTQTGKPLDNLQRCLIGKLWQQPRQKYLEIAIENGYSEAHVKDVAYQLWQILSKALGEKVNKNNFRSVIEQCGELQSQPYELDQQQKKQKFKLPERIAPVRNWVGRSQELDALKSQILDPNTRSVTITAVCVVGLAGVGKTTLASQLLRQFQLEESPFVKAGWESLRSITGKPPRFDDIVDHLLFELSNGEITPAVTILDDYFKKTERLIQILREFPCLIVIDNAETVLKVKQAHLAGYFANDWAEYAWFLQQLAEADHKSKVIFTSRETLAQLQNQVTNTFKLGGLDLEAALHLLQSFNLIGTEIELKELAQRYEGHPKALEIVSAIVQEDFQGNVREFLINRKWLLVRDLETLVDEVIDRLSQEEYLCLSCISVYQTTEYPLHATGIQAQMPNMNRREIEENIILALRRRQLLNYNSPDQSYQIHPLIQEKSFSLLNKETFYMAHLQAYKYFVSISKPEHEWKEIEDVRTLVRAHYHACQIHNWDKSYLVTEKIYDFLKKKNYFDLIIDLYSELVPEKWKEGERLVSSLYDHVNILLGLGNAYFAITRWSLAQDYYEYCLIVSQENKFRQMEAKALCYLSLTTQDKQKAINYLSNSLTISTTIKDHYLECKCLEYLGLIYKNIGNYSRSTSYHQRCLEISRRHKFQEEEGIALGNLGTVCEEIKDYKSATFYQEEYLRIARETGNLKRQAHALFGLSSIANKKAEYFAAIQYAEIALSIAKEIKDKHCENFSIFNLAVAYRGIERHQDAINLFKLCIESDREIGFEPRQGESFFQLGLIYETLNVIDKCVENFRHSLEIFSQCGNQARKAEVLLELVRATLGTEVLPYEIARDYLAQAEKISGELQLPLIRVITEIRKRLD